MTFTQPVHTYSTSLLFHAPCAHKEDGTSGKTEVQLLQCKKTALAHTEGEPCQLATAPASTCPDSANTGNKI